MKRSYVLFALLAVAALPAYGQFPEDALRFATPGIGVGARAVGMGGAYSGIANDYSALYWNPAGLTQVRKLEFSIGMGYLGFHDKSSFGTESSISGEPMEYSASSTSLNALGFVMPLPAQRGKASLALGYNRGGSFATGLGFEGFNAISSIVQSYAPDSTIAPYDLSNNLAYQLYLANVDTTTGRFISPITGGLTQLANVIEKGGLDHWSFGGAMEIARDISVGGKVTYVAGSYGYERAYKERDTRNEYGAASFPFNIDEVALDEYVESDISGVFGKFGLLIAAPDILRVGLTITTPTWLSVTEIFGTRGRSWFDDGESFSYDEQGGGAYEVVTPWVFGGGASVVLEDLLVFSGDAEWTDWTALEFQNANPDVMALNQEIRTLFTSTLNWRVGAELDLMNVLRLRAGYQVNPSAFKDDPPEFDRKYITAGVGIPLGASFMLDAAYAYGSWTSYRVNYVDPRNALQPRVDEEITTHNAMLTLTYRH